MALIGLAVLCGLTLILWGISFALNRVYQDRLTVAAAEAAVAQEAAGVQVTQVSRRDPDLERVVGVLDQLRALPGGYADQRGGVNLLQTFGLYQGGHSDRAERAYRQGLRRILLPRLLLRLEAFLAGHSTDPMAVYEPFKVYLMLGGQKTGDIDKTVIRNWIENDWNDEVYPGPDRADLRKRLSEHLDALLEDRHLSYEWPKRTAPLHGSLIKEIRATIRGMELADRAFVILYQKSLSAGSPWRAGDFVSVTDAAVFANGEEVRALTVPYFFTHDGYEKVYQLSRATVGADLKSDLWVLGEDANTSSLKDEIDAIGPGLAGRYAQAYLAAWNGVVAAPRPADYFSNQTAFNLFTRPQSSPLKALLKQVVIHTKFEGGSRAAVDAVKSAGANALGSASKVVTVRTSVPDAGRQIEAGFADLHTYVGDDKTPGRIDQFIAAVKKTGDALLAAGAMNGQSNPQIDAAKATARAELAGFTNDPGSPAGFITGVVKVSETADDEVVRSSLQQYYASQILPACANAAQDKYPFNASSRVDADFLQVDNLLRTDGIMDSFLQQRLTPHMDITGPVWRWRSGEFDASSAEKLSHVRTLRDLLKTGFEFDVQPVSVGEGVDAIRFSSGNDTQVMAANDTAAKRMQWTFGGKREAFIELIKGGTPVTRLESKGTWALFHVIDQARPQNSGDDGILATVGQGTQTATVRISFETPFNPFGRGGVWSLLRCPAKL